MSDDNRHRLVRGMIGLLHDWKGAGKSLSKVDYFPGVKKVEVPKLAALSPAGLSDVLSTFVDNAIGYSRIEGADVAAFLKEFLAETSLTWNSEQLARLETQPSFERLVDELLPIMVDWYENKRKVPARFKEAFEPQLKSLDAKSRERFFQRYRDAAGDPDLDWDRRTVEAFLKAIAGKPGSSKKKPR